MVGGTRSKKALRIIRMIKDTQSDLFGGIGNLSRSSMIWQAAGLSALIMSIALCNQVLKEKIRILACRYHY